MREAPFTIFLHPKQFDQWVRLGLIKTREDPNKWTSWLRQEYTTGQSGIRKFAAADRRFDTSPVIHFIAD